MYWESNGEKDFNEAQVMRAIALRSNKPEPIEFPWPDLTEHILDLRVAETIKGSVNDARTLPLYDFYAYLMIGSAQAEALPAQMENQNAKAKAAQKREEDAKRR
jgi:hypothetical protein